MFKRFIDEEYLIEYGWENKTANGEKFFSEPEMLKLIQKASSDIYNILEIPHFKELESLSTIHQNSIRRSTAMQFENYSQNGENFLDIMKKISSGNLNVEIQSQNSDYPHIPAAIFIELEKHNLYDNLEEIDDDEKMEIFSSEFKNKLKVQNGTIELSSEEQSEFKRIIRDIEDLPDKEFTLLSKAATIELLNDLSIGKLSFATGESLSEVGIIGQGTDKEIYRRSRVDELFSEFQDILNTKANLSEVVLKSAFSQDKKTQDNQISRNANQSKNNKTIIDETLKVLELGGTSVESFKVVGDKTIVNTALKISPAIKLVSNKPALTYEVTSGITYFIAKTNGKIQFEFKGTAKKGNTNDIVTYEVRLREFGTDILLDKATKQYDFTNNFEFMDQNILLETTSSGIGENGKLQSKFYIEVLTLEATRTILVADNSLLLVTLLSQQGTGNIATTDSVLNASSVLGSTLTQALDNLLSAINNKASQTDLTALATNLTDNYLTALIIQQKLDLKTNQLDFLEIAEQVITE